MGAYRRRLIADSLGNLAGWHHFATSGPGLSLSALLEVQMGPQGRFHEGETASLRLDGSGVPHRDHSESAAKLTRRLSYSDSGRRLPITRIADGRPRY